MERTQIVNWRHLIRNTQSNMKKIVMKNFQTLQDLAYRLNSMRAWDLMMYTKDKYAAYNAKENNESFCPFDSSKDSLCFGKFIVNHPLACEVLLN